MANESANKVWQRVTQASMGYNEATRNILKGLKLYLATQKNVQQLSFAAINGLVNSSDSGNTASQVLSAAACTLYALVLKKAAGATACWFKGSNHATTATTDGTQVISEHSAAASEEICRIWPNGKALSAGLTVTEDTTATGSTLTLLANRFDGFVIFS